MIELVSLLDPDGRAPLLVIALVTILSLVYVIYRFVFWYLNLRESKLDGVVQMVADLQLLTNELVLHQQSLESALAEQDRQLEKDLKSHIHNTELRLQTYEERMLALIDRQTQYFEKMLKLQQEFYDRQNHKDA